MWLQDSELTAKVGSMPTAYPADSTKAFCEVCNNAIIAKYCNSTMQKEKEGCCLFIPPALETCGDSF